MHAATCSVHVHSLVYWASLLLVLGMDMCHWLLLCLCRWWGPESYRLLRRCGWLYQGCSGTSQGRSILKWSVLVWMSGWGYTICGVSGAFTSCFGSWTWLHRLTWEVQLHHGSLGLLCSLMCVLPSHGWVWSTGPMPVNIGCRGSVLVRWLISRTSQGFVYRLSSVRGRT